MTVNKTRFKNENLLLKFISSNSQFGERLSAIIAIDEVGRGCVAGSVMSCTSLWIKKSKLLKKYQTKKQEWLPEIKDSKKISEKKRKTCFDKILNEYDFTFQNFPTEIQTPCSPSELILSNKQIHFNLGQSEDSKEKYEAENNEEFECISFSIGEVTANEVDQFNIWNAVQLAASRALTCLYKDTNLETAFKNLVFESTILLMDGNHFIKVPVEYKNNLQVTVIKADDHFVSVGFSSILAKVYRDTCMEIEDIKFPSFGFAGHKGYGTPKHLTLIQQIGTSPIHRISFLKNYITETLF